MEDEVKQEKSKDQVGGTKKGADSTGNTEVTM